MLLEFTFEYYRGTLLKYFNVTLVVLARWSQCALGASLVQKHHIRLEIDCRLLQIQKPFLLELTPDLFLRRILRIDRVLIVVVILMILFQVLFLRQWRGISHKRSSRSLF